MKTLTIWTLRLSLRENPAFNNLARGSRLARALRVRRPAVVSAPSQRCQICHYHSGPSNWPAGEQSTRYSPPPPRTVSVKGKEKAATQKGPSHTGASSSAESGSIHRPARDEPSPRNPLGVQLLSPFLSSQVFPPTQKPTPKLHPHAVSLSQAHLASHGLSASQGSVLKPTQFVAPPLQGSDLGEHFWNIGREAAEPWLSLSEGLANCTLAIAPENVAPSAEEQLPDYDDHGRPSPRHWINMDAPTREMVEPQRPRWLRRSGWVRYPILRSSDGKDTFVGEGEPVPYPDLDDQALVFDVETMVTSGPWSVMATAVGQKAWYSWISPWLLGETEKKDQLIPFGPLGASNPPRLLVGHNVGYDRARILDEYSLTQSNIRFMDTQSLHVAVRGIASPQRPVWIQHRKARAQRAVEKMLKQKELKEEERQELMKLLGGEELEETALEILGDMGVDLDVLAPTDLPSPAQSYSGANGDTHPREQLQWQDIGSANSLADVAALHCNITLPKELRNIFVVAQTRDEIIDRIDDLLNYCARDVEVTHAVFAKVLPAFRKACPHPATFAGVMSIGSSILPIDDEWLQYQRRSERKYEEALEGVRAALVSLAESLKEEHDRRKAEEPDWYASNPWYSQLDWEEKKPRKDKSQLGEDGDDGRVPRWYRQYVLAQKTPTAAHSVSPMILRLTLDDQPVTRKDRTWYAGSEALSAAPLSKVFLKSADGDKLRSQLGPDGDAALAAIKAGEGKEEVGRLLTAAAEAIYEQSKIDSSLQEALESLDWTMVEPPASQAISEDGSTPVTWPKWYWDLYKSDTGQLEVTVRTNIAPLLLNLSWLGCPLFRSREHGWMYAHFLNEHQDFTTRHQEVTFNSEADAAFEIMKSNESRPVKFYKVPHTSGDEANVGSPFSKSFMGYFDDGTLRSEHPEAMGKETSRAALDLNAQCSYWIGVRDRVANQMVVWEGEGGTQMGFQEGPSGMGKAPEDTARAKGIILPQIVSMGTITRRAIEKTWLTASNAKKNRVGSELKAMVKAPPGWAIVGADVDSEELWICSVMGDAQFGLHGATAIGWMTLEGTKSAGTDLHSKTAGILGTSRNQAKVFNYSRIYGAGIRHATQLLLKANPGMAKDDAQAKAKQLYASTKGGKTRSVELFGRRFWYGGSESYVFNKLEDVAISHKPRTPALDCGITAALSRKFLPKSNYGNGGDDNDYMPSRINWVVQSSGVDYLHLLIVSMSHLCRHYDIGARFMISVHDEVRYLAREEDATRTALALQIANLWTRAMFAFKLEMEDLPEGVAWFAQVDVDKILRKEVDDPCVTPSHPNPVAKGEALDVAQILERTGGSLYRDGRPMDGRKVVELDTNAYPPYEPSDQRHRSFGDDGIMFLQAQASNDLDEIRALQRRAERMPGGQFSPKSYNATNRRPKPPMTSSSRARLSSATSSESSAYAAQPSVKLSTFTRTAASHASSAPTLPPALQDLLAVMPRLKKKPRFRPEPELWFRKPGYRQYVRWGLYRRLLRAVPESHKDLKLMIKIRFWRYKDKWIKKVKALEEVARAESFLQHCLAAQSGDASSLKFLTTELNFYRARKETFKAGQERHAVLVSTSKRIRLSLLSGESSRRGKLLPLPGPRPPRDPSIPRRPLITGSFVSASIYNPPMLRMKPQRVQVSMMIKRRTNVRAKRIQVMADLWEQKRWIEEERRFWNEVQRARGSSSSAPPIRSRSLSQAQIRPSQSSEPSQQQQQQQQQQPPPTPPPTADDDADDAAAAFSSTTDWFQSIRLYENEMQRSFNRERQRASMTLTPRMLRRAKRMRVRMLQWKTYRKRMRDAAAAVAEKEGIQGQDNSKGRGKGKRKARKVTSRNGRRGMAERSEDKVKPTAKM